MSLEWVNEAFGATQQVAMTVVSAVEEGACNIWKTILPPQLQKGLKLTQKNPWRSIWRGFNLTAPSLVVYALPPFTFPLAMMFFPILIWLETTRIAWAIFANCGSVTDTLKQEAKDLLALLDELGANRPAGKMIRTTLRLAGQSGIIDSFDEFYPKVRRLLDPVSKGRTLQANDVLAFALASAQLSGDPEVLAMAKKTNKELKELEGQAVQVLGENNQLGDAPILRNQKSMAGARPSRKKSSRKKSSRAKAIRESKARQKEARKRLLREKMVREAAVRKAAREGTTLTTSPPYDPGFNTSFPQLKAGGWGMALGLALASGAGIYLLTRKK